MRAVPVERDGVGDLAGHGGDGRLNAEGGQRAHRGGVELRHRHRLQRDVARGAVAHIQPQHVIDEVEIDLELASAGRHRSGGQPARGHIERDVPGMVQPWRQREADLADHLGPQMQRRAGVAPIRGRQRGPAFRLRYLHHLVFLLPTPRRHLGSVRLRRKDGAASATYPHLIALWARHCIDQAHNIWHWRLPSLT